MSQLEAGAEASPRAPLPACADAGQAPTSRAYHVGTDSPSGAQEELRGLNSAAEALQGASEAALRTERDAARLRVMELESALAAAQAAAATAAAAGGSAVAAGEGVAPGAAEAERAGRALGGGLSEADVADMDEGEAAAALQGAMSRGQQLLDVRSQLRHELAQLQVCRGGRRAHAGVCADPQLRRLRGRRATGVVRRARE
jgi:hypothetical protein